jgi:hypothetical protein
MTARDVRTCGGAEDHYLIAEDATASGKSEAPSKMTLPL